MTTKAQQRKEVLREKLIVAAEERIDRDGVGALRARDLAKDAGCAVGAIYTAYDDLNALIMAVNGRTFQKLGQVVASSVDGAGEETATSRLILMSNAYLGFASDHTNLWRALFDLQMRADDQVPDWYLQALRTLFSHIARPVAELFPDYNHEQLDLMVRALFSSVHGIVLLGLEQRISAVPLAKVEQMIGQVLSQVGQT
ncbi:TetR/AcrR family transcriptional regulator [Parasedimentitalea marina]|uniref:TetR/AcrR family transcriptional regulator n=1 Tax=Parasedimentitalea marina TaxID=2483033 RepID=A0A3T0N414_9RHOB|nr:WHG domain-containing protein [Parasedimentitalea marina]AZV78768.1 TetR/AcrR family transcriptional regulator [Parasedimentitalea marina]